MWPGFAAAVLAPLLSLLVRVMLGDALVGYPFITFFPAVVFTALVGNRSAAALATLWSAALASRYAVDATASLVPQSGSAWIGIAFFVVVCATITALIHWLYRSLDQLSFAQEELKRANLFLEARVGDRTRDLEHANEQLRVEAKARETAEANFRQVQKMQAVGNLTGGIAHDFNNMLAIVISAVDLAKRRLAKGNTDIMPMLDAAMDGAKRAATLTQRLLAFSRQSPLKPMTLDANRLVSGMEDMLRRTIGEEIEMEFVLGGGVWPTNVDPNELENAIINLAVNARDAMPNGGKVTVETSNGHLDDDYACRHPDVSPGQYVVIAVTDTGKGMPPDVVERAFDPFFSTKGPGHGTGLGLSQIYGFVKQSSGHVKIYSEVGHGTTVKIYLKRANEQHAQAVASQPAEPMPRGTHDQLVVVVEDDTGVRKLTVDALRELGYTVRHAASGKEALDLLANLGSVTLLFTDVVMPGMSGRELADTARRERPELRVVYTTGYTRNAIVHNGVLDQDVELLQKPFTVEQLARKVKKALAG